MIPALLAPPSGSDLENFPEHLAGELSGLHFHTLCEQNADDLETTLAAVEEKFREIPELPNIEWLNMGGGHHITRPDYDIARLERCILHIKRDLRRTGIPGAGGEAIAFKMQAIW